MPPFSGVYAPQTAAKANRRATAPPALRHPQRHRHAIRAIPDRPEFVSPSDRTLAPARRSDSRIRDRFRLHDSAPSPSPEPASLHAEIEARGGRSRRETPSEAVAPPPSNIDLWTIIIGNCGFTQTRHKGGHAGRLPRFNRLQKLSILHTAP